jgi:hypothetical protein
MAVTEEESIDASYLDVTAEELLAVCSMVGVPPPFQVVGAGDVDVEAVSAAARRGRRSLLARGLARTVESDEQIDEALATTMETVSAPGLAAFVTALTQDGQSLTGMYVDDARAVVLGTLEPGLFRLRLLPPDVFGAALVLVCGLEDAVDAGPIEPSELPLDPALLDDDGADERVVAEAVTRLVASLPPAVRATFGAGGTTTSVIGVVRDPSGDLVTRSLVWHRSSDDRWAELQLADQVLRVVPASPGHLSERLVDIASRPVPASNGSEGAPT